MSFGCKFRMWGWCFGVWLEYNQNHNQDCPKSKFEVGVSVSLTTVKIKSHICEEGGAKTTLYTVCPHLFIHPLVNCLPLFIVHYILSVPPLYTVRPPYILSVPPYILSVSPYILSVSPFILSVPPYILSVMRNIFLSLIEILYQYSAEFLEQIGSLSRGTIVSDSLTQ